MADVDTTPAILQVHTDQIDRPLMMTDGGKSVVWAATWLPFGGVHQITGSASLDYRFPGQWFQLESGLHDNWHRHYDPTTGRYLQADPLGLDAGISRWAYAYNSPLMVTDPDGRFAWWVLPLVFGGADLLYQFSQYGDNWQCYDLWEVGFWALSGYGVFGGAKAIGPALHAATGGRGAWIRYGASFSNALGQKTTRTLSWGSNAHYAQGIGNATLRSINQSLRSLRLPPGTSSWRTSDPGHLQVIR